jgi:hypothetical protein
MRPSQICQAGVHAGMDLPKLNTVGSCQPRA